MDKTLVFPATFLLDIKMKLNIFIWFEAADWTEKV